MFSSRSEEAAALVQQWAEEFISGPANDLGRPSGPREPAFGQPLFGFAAGDDPIWTEFKKAVGPDHWRPEEAFALAFPEEAAGAGELSVVSWVLPQTEATLRDQRAARDFPCERWARSRQHGQPQVVDGLARHLLQRLGEAGVQAVAPDFLPQWHWIKGGPLVITSNWSQRHAAHAAGLGTFGLCDGLITPVGKAARFGSLVVRGRFPVRPRDYSGPYDYCLFFNSGTCGKCAKRCPAGAVGPQGHDKQLCHSYIYDQSVPYLKAQWPDLNGSYGCGLCQAAVPCDNRIPPRPARR